MLRLVAHEVFYTRHDLVQKLLLVQKCAEA